jgi:hypothetical protein
MTLGTLAFAMAAIWLGLLVGLFRLVAAIDRTERQMPQPDVQGRPAQEPPRG